MRMAPKQGLAHRANHIYGSFICFCSSLFFIFRRFSFAWRCFLCFVLFRTPSAATWPLLYSAVLGCMFLTPTNQVGGPAYRIGLGGGAASSRVGDAKTASLDFDAVQRGDAEMENRLNRLMRACVELGDANPIISIHDQVSYACWWFVFGLPRVDLAVFGSAGLFCVFGM